MAKVVVDVMLKPEILDPQGQAIERALPALGFDQVSNIRQGKHFELDVEAGADGAVTEATLDDIRELARTLLSNPVIEDFVVRPAETS